MSAVDIFFLTIISLLPVNMGLLYWAARKRRRSGYWLWWGVAPFPIGWIALFILLKRHASSFEQQQQSRQRSGVPVGPGTVLGVLMFLPGLGMCFTDLSDESNATMIRLIGALLAVVGAALAGGGIYVLRAERKAKGVSVPLEDTKRTPKWAYAFAVLTFVGCFVGALLGLHFARYSGRFFPGFIVGAIAGPCGAVAAYSCILTSRKRALSIPRRIYACILIAGFSCPLAMGFAYKLFSGS